MGQLQSQHFARTNGAAVTRSRHQVGQRAGAPPPAGVASSELVDAVGGGTSRLSPPAGGSAESEIARSARADSAPHGASAEVLVTAMASSGVTVSASGSASEAPQVPDNVGDWLRGVYRFATDRNDFRRNLILNLGLFAAGVWLARNLSDIDLMAPQPGV
ncbi:mitochondrial import receptor subunit TOM6 homolog [Phodopus roborovskii]|nr:mitochondrial import receptor subunit TOM6 homolog [Phodopus roborovskii]